MRGLPRHASFASSGREGVVKGCRHRAPLLSTVQEFATANTCCAAIMTRLLQVVALALLVVCVYAQVDIDTLSARVVRTRPA